MENKHFFPLNQMLEENQMIFNASFEKIVAAALRVNDMGEIRFRKKSVDISFGNYYYSK